MRRIALLFLVGVVVLGCSRGGSSTSGKGDPWSTVAIGSVFVTKTMTLMQTPFVHETVATTKQTLLARDAAEVTVKLEITEGDRTTTQDVKIPLRQDEPKPHDGSTVTTAEEKCTVPAGTFDCTRTTMELHDGDVTRSTETWRAKNIPVPIKSVVTNENMTVTTELTSLSVGR